MTSFARYYKNRELIEVSMSEIDTLCKTETNQALIAEHVYERLYNRFLKIFDFKADQEAEYIKGGIALKRNVFTEEYKNGFVMMASCSLLIETLASFLTGEDETPRKQGDAMFNMVFEYAEKKNNSLKQFKGMKFYEHVRCGLLHQGETYGKFKITRVGPLFHDNTINATLFFKHLKALLITYRTDLEKESWNNATWSFCKKKIGHIIQNAI